MKLSAYVRLSLDAFDRGELEAALMFACSAVDQTGRRVRPSAGVRKRFECVLYDYAWLVEPMLALGFDLKTSAFAWPVLKGTGDRFTGVLYQLHRNHLIHGEALPGGSILLARESDEQRRMRVSADRIDLPDTVIFALLAVAVFAETNVGEKIGGAGHWLSHAGRRFPVDEWWGREDDVRDYFDDAAANLPRITMDFRDPPEQRTPLEPLDCA